MWCAYVFAAIALVGLPAVLASAATMRPTDGPAAIVVPLLALPFPAVTDAIRYAVTQSNVNAYIAEPFNVNLTFAEALHIRLADAHLARADRVRMFSIPTAADGIIVATVGGDQAAAAAIPTSVLLAARLALPEHPRRLRRPARCARQRGQAHDPRLRADPGRDRVTPRRRRGRFLTLRPPRHVPGRSLGKPAPARLPSGLRWGVPGTRRGRRDRRVAQGNFTPGLPQNGA